MADIIFVARLDSRQLKKDLKDLGKNIPDVDLPIETNSDEIADQLRERLQEIGAEPISISLDTDTANIIEQLKTQLNSENFKLNLAISKDSLNEIKAKAAQIKPETQIKVDVSESELDKLVDKIADRVDQRLSKKKQKPKVQVEAEVDTEDAEKEIKKLTKPRKISIQIEPVSNFPKAELRGREDDTRYMAQLSRNPKAKIAKEIFPGIEARGGVSASQGFKAGITITDAPKVINTINDGVRDIVNAILSEKGELSKQLGKIIKFPGGKPTPPSPLSPVRAVGSVVGGVFGDIASGFSSAIGYQLLTAVSTQVLPGIGKSINSKLNKYTTAVDALVRFPGLKVPTVLAERANESATRQTAGLRKTANFLESFGGDQSGQSSIPVEQALGGKRQAQENVSKAVSASQYDKYGRPITKTEDTRNVVQKANTALDTRLESYDQKVQSITSRLPTPAANFVKNQADLAVANTRKYNEYFNSIESTRAKQLDKGEISTATGTNVASQTTAQPVNQLSSQSIGSAAATGVNREVGSLHNTINTATDRIVNAISPKENPILKLFKSGFNLASNLVAKPILRTVEGFKSQVSYQFAEKFGKGVSNAVESGLGLDLGNLGAVSGTRTAKGLERLSSKLGITEGEEDFKAYIGDIQRFLEETQNDGNLLQASIKRYRANFAKIAVQAREEVNQEYAEQGESYLEGKKLSDNTNKVILPIAGFGGEQGKGSYRHAEIMQQIFPEHAVVPVLNKETDAAVSGKTDIKKWMGSGLGRLLRIQLKGFNQDAVDALKEVYRIELANPDKEIEYVATGYSAGGGVASDFAEMARQGNINVKSFTFGTPLITNAEQDPSRNLNLMGELDYMRVLGGIKTPDTHQSTKSGILHTLPTYVLHDELQQKLTEFVDGQAKYLSEEQKEYILHKVEPKEFLNNLENFKSPGFAANQNHVNAQTEVIKQQATSQKSMQPSLDMQKVAAQTQENKQQTGIVKAKIQEAGQVIDTIIAQINQSTEDVVNEFQQIRAAYEQKEEELRQAYQERTAEIVRELQQEQESNSKQTVQSQAKESVRKVVKQTNTPNNDVRPLGIELPAKGAYLPQGSTGTKKDYVSQAQANREQFKTALKQIEKSQPGRAKLAQLEELINLIDQEYENIQEELTKDVDSQTRQYLERYGKNEPLKQKVQVQLEQARKVVEQSEGDIPKPVREPLTENTITEVNANRQLQRVITDDKKLKIIAQERYRYQERVADETPKNQTQASEFVFREEDLPDIAWSVPSMLQSLQMGFQQTVDSVKDKLVNSTQVSSINLFEYIASTVNAFIEQIQTSFASQSISQAVGGDTEPQEELTPEDKLSHAHQFVAEEVAKRSGQQLDTSKLPQLLSQEEYTKLAGKDVPVTHKRGGLYDPVHNSIILGETYRQALQEGESNKHYTNAVKTLAHEHRHAQQYKLGDRTSAFFDQYYHSGKAEPEEIKQASPIELRHANAIQQIKLNHRIKGSAGETNRFNRAIEEDAYVFEDEEGDDIAQKLKTSKIKQSNASNEIQASRSLPGGFIGNLVQEIAKIIKGFFSNVFSLFGGNKQASASVSANINTDQVNTRTHAQEYVKEEKAKEEYLIIASPEAIRIQEFIANEVNKVSRGEKIDPDQTPKLITQQQWLKYVELQGGNPEEYKGVGGLYSPPSNTIWLSDKKMTAINQGKTHPGYQDAISALIHENRHAQQLNFGDKETYAKATSALNDKNITEKDVKAIIPIELIKPNKEEKNKLQKGIDFSTGSGNQYLRMIEEDAYTFESRHTSGIIQKLAKSERTNKSQAKNASQLTQNLPSALKGLPGNVFGAIIQEMDDSVSSLFKTVKTQLKASFKLAFSDPSKFKTKADSYSSELKSELDDSIDHILDEIAKGVSPKKIVETALKSAFSAGGGHEKEAEPQDDETIKKNAIQLINTQLEFVGKTEFALDPSDTRILGSGVHSTVLGSSANDPRKLAYKTNPNPDETAAMIRLQEAGIKSIPAVHYADEKVLVSEQIKGKDLQSVIQELVKETDPQKKAANVETLNTIVKNLGIAVKDFHEKGFIHTDMQNQNILVQEDLTPKFIDLEYARIAEKPEYQQLEQSNVLHRIEDVIKVFDKSGDTSYLKDTKQAFMTAYGDKAVDKPRNPVKDVVDTINEFRIQKPNNPLLQDRAKEKLVTSSKVLGQITSPELIEGITGFTRYLSSKLIEFFNQVKKFFADRLKAITQPIEQKLKEEYYPDVVWKDMQQKKAAKKEKKETKAKEAIKQAVAPVVGVAQKIQKHPYTESFVKGQEHAKDLTALGALNPSEQLIEQAVVKPVQNFAKQQSLNVAKSLISEDKAQEAVEALSPLTAYLDEFFIEVDKGSSSVEYLFNLLEKIGGVTGNPIDLVSKLPGILKDVEVLKGKQKEFIKAQEDSGNQYNDIFHYIQTSYIEKHKQEIEERVSKLPPEKQEEARTKLYEGMYYHGLGEVVGEVPTIRDVVAQGARQVKTQNIQNAVEQVKKDFAKSNTDNTTNEQHDDAHTKVYAVSGFADLQGKYSHDIAEYLKVATKNDPQVSIKAFENPYSDDDNYSKKLIGNVLGNVNPDSLNLFREIYETHQKNPKQRQVVISHSGGGYNAQDVAEMAAVANIPVEVMGIGTPNLNIVRRLNEQRYKAVSLEGDPIVNTNLEVGKLMGYGGSQDKIFKGSTHSIEEFLGRKDSHEAILELIYNEKRSQDKDRLKPKLYRSISNIRSLQQSTLDAAKESLPTVKNNSPEGIAYKKEMVAYLDAGIKDITKEASQLPEDVKSRLLKDLEEINSIRNQLFSNLQELKLEDIKTQSDETMLGVNEALKSIEDKKNSPEAIEYRKQMLDFIDQALHYMATEISELSENIPSKIVEDLNVIKEKRNQLAANVEQINQIEKTPVTKTANQLNPEDSAQVNTAIANAFEYAVDGLSFAGDSSPEAIQYKKEVIDYLDQTTEYILQLSENLPSEILKDLSNIETKRKEIAASLEASERNIDLTTKLDEQKNQLSIKEVETQSKDTIRNALESANEALALNEDNSPEVVQFKKEIIDYLNSTVEYVTSQFSDLPDELKAEISKDIEKIQAARELLVANVENIDLQSNKLPKPAHSVPDNKPAHSKHQHAITAINKELESNPELQLHPETTKLLGKGSEGAVYGTTADDKRKLAYKFVQQNESSALQGLQDKKLGFIPQVVAVKNNLLVHEQVIGKTLADLSDSLNTKDLSSIITKNAAMLRQVHDAGYTHGDFHSGNIMLDEQSQSKIIDFGKSKKISSNKDDAEEELFEDYINGLSGQKISFGRRLSDKKIEELFDQGYNNPQEVLQKATESQVPVINQVENLPQAAKSVPVEPYGEILKARLKSFGKRSLEFVNRIGIETGKANNNLSSYFNEKVEQAKGFAIQIRNKTGKLAQPAIPTMQAIALDFGEKIGQFNKKLNQPRKPILESIQDRLQVEVDKLVNQTEKFLFPDNTPSYKELFPSVTERFGKFLGRQTQATGEGIANTIPERAEASGMAAQSGLISRIPIVGKVASKAYQSATKFVADNSRLIASSYDQDVRAGVNLGRVSQQDKLPGKVYKAVERVSPALAEVGIAGVGGVAALKTPMQNLAEDVIRLRGKLDFGKALGKFQSDWITSFKKVSASIQVGKQLEEIQKPGLSNLGALASRLTLGLPRVIGRVASKIDVNTRISQLPSIAKEAVQFTDAGDKVGGTLDDIGFKAKAVSTAFKVGFNGIHKPLELLEETGNKVFDGLGTNLRQFTQGFLSFQAIRVATDFIKNAGVEAIKAYAQFDKLKTVLNFAQGGVVAGDKAVEFVRGESKEKKIPLLSSIEGYSQLSASTKGSNVAGAATNELFQSITDVSTVMSWSADQQNRVLNVLGDMASQGKVSTDKLKYELGIQLPGTMQIAARSMGMSVGELNQSLEAGLIDVERFFPAFSRQLKTEFGGSVKDASNNVLSSMYNIQNSTQELQISFGKILAPVAQRVLNTTASGIDLVNEGLRTSGGTLTALATSSAIVAIRTGLSMFTASIGSVSLLNIAIMGLSATMGFIARIALPFLAQFIAINAVMSTFSSIYGGITDKGGDMAKFADETSQRLKKIADAANKTNKELDNIANKEYTPPPANIFDEVGRSLGGFAGERKADTGAVLKSGGMLAASAGSVAGYAAFQMAGGVAAGMPAVMAALPMAIAAAVGGAIAAPVGYAVNRAVMTVRTGGSDTGYYGWSEKARDERRVAAGEAGENIDKLIGQSQQYIGLSAERDPKTGKRKLAARGDLAAVQEIDRQISQQSAVLSGIPDTDPKGRQEGEAKLKALNEQRKEKATELTEFQSQLSGTITQLKEQVANEQDPQVKQMLQARLDSAQKWKDMLDRVAAPNTDPLVKFANAINMIAASLEEAERKGRAYITTRNLAAKQAELKDFGTDQFANQKAATQTAKNQVEGLKQELEARDKSQNDLKVQLQNPEFKEILKARGIDENASIGDLRTKVKEEELKPDSQKNSKYRAILDATIQYREEEAKTGEKRLQLTEAELQVRQAEESEELARIDERSKSRQTKAESHTAIQSEEITKSVGKGKLREGAASNARADNELQASLEQVSDMEQQLSDLRDSRDKLSAKEFIQRERDLSKQLIESRTRVAEKSNEIEKNRLDNQLNDIKGYYSDVKTISEGQVASGAITAEEGARKSLDITDKQTKQQLDAITAERKRIGKNNPELTRKLDVKEAEVYKQQQDSIKNYASERSNQINTSYESQKAQDERTLADGKVSFDRFNQDRLASALKNANDLDKVLSEQRKRTPAKNQLALDEITKQEAENHKKRLDAYRQYYDELNQLTQSKYQALIGTEENRFALGEVNSDEFFNKRLELSNQSLDEQEDALEQKRQSPLGQDPREKIKLDNEQNEIDKKRLDNLRQYYEERQNLVKSQSDAELSELEAMNAEGAVVGDDYLQERLDKQQAFNDQELAILNERRNSNLGRDPRELAKIEAEEAAIRKRGLDNLRSYYEERQNLIKSQSDAELAQLEVSRGEGGIVDEDYLQERLAMQDASSQQQLAVLQERQSSNLGLDPKELVKILTEEAAIRKQALDNLRSYYEERQNLIKSRSDAEIAELEAAHAEGGTFDEDYLNARLAKQRDVNAQELAILQERKQSSLGLDPRELDKIQTEEANIRKRGIDNLRAYYDERDNLEKQRVEASQASLRSQLESGATTAQNYYDQQYQITLEGIKKQRDVLGQRKTDLGSNPEELRKIEQQEAELNERQSKAAKEHYDNLNNLLEQHLNEANNTAKLAETQRVLDAETIFNQDRTVPKQIALEGERLQAQSERIQVELSSEQARNEAMKKVRFSNPLDEQKRVLDVQSSDQRILDLTKQRIDSQVALEDNHRDAVKRSLDEVLDTRKLNAEAAIALAEQESKAQDLLIASYDRQAKLAKANQDLGESRSALGEFRGQSQVDKYNRALELRRKLDNKDLSGEARSEIEKQLGTMGFSGASSELEIIQKRQDAENKLAKLQEEAKLKQLELSRQQAELDNLRNIQLARQAVKQAELNELQASNNIVSAQKQLNDALTAKVKDPVAIAAAQQGVKIAQMQADASSRQVADKKEELATTMQLADKQRSILANQAELTKEQLAKADADRKSAQALERAEAATSNMTSNTSTLAFSQMQKRFKGGLVQPGQPYIVGEDPSTGKILPSSEIFVPQTAGRILTARETREILLPQVYKSEILSPFATKEVSASTPENNNQPVVKALADIKNLIANRKPSMDANFTLVNEVDPTSKVLELQRKMMFNFGV
jgi:tape measure domain-containing protein